MLNLYKNILRPIAFRFDAEKIHELGLNTLRVSLASKAAQRVASNRYTVDGMRPFEKFGLQFPNPIGIAAGFDKNAVVAEQLGSLGFGFVEVGTVTAEPQPGNEKPRLFRLPDDMALINRLGFNNKGAVKAAESLSKLERNCVVGVNIGKNKTVPNEEAIPNYLAVLDRVLPYADYIAVNVSSPNTPNLRALQEAGKLNELLLAISKRIAKHAEETKLNAKPLMLKIAPDVSSNALDEIIDICIERSISGIIATNTTIKRENLKTPSSQVDSIGAGGVSGQPLKEQANGVIRHIYTRTEGMMPVIGVGGVFDASDAFEKISLGACLVQAYTGFVYQGPSFARKINKGLVQILESKGFGDVSEAVGCAI